MLKPGMKIESGFKGSLSYDVGVIEVVYDQGYVLYKSLYDGLLYPAYNNSFREIRVV